MAIQEHAMHPRHNATAIGTLVFLAVFILLFFLGLSWILARLVYYKGQFGPSPTKYTILPEYLRERAKAEKIADRWTGRVIVDESLIPTDWEVRAQIREELRISRLPAFEQDDCGDGSNFPDVPLVNHLSTLVPVPIPSFRERSHYITMGLKKLDIEDWLQVDNTYPEFYTARSHILETQKEEALQVTPSGEEACEELMELVVEFLLEKYPRFFEIVETNGRKKIRNNIVKEEISIQKPYDVHPLEVCARLCVEDFNILQKSEFSGEHYLVASATIFPAGWRLRERIGKSVTDLHGPVPLWKDYPNILNLSYFTRLSTNSYMERHSFFIQINPDDRPLSQLLFIQRGQDFYPGKVGNFSPPYFIIRRERQTFRRLPKSNTVVFTVKTSVQKLTDLPAEGRRGLVKEIRSWPDDIKEYKGLQFWKKPVFAFCEGQNRAEDEEDDAGR